MCPVCIAVGMRLVGLHCSCVAFGIPSLGGVSFLQWGLRVPGDIRLTDVNYKRIDKVSSLYLCACLSCVQWSVSQRQYRANIHFVCGHIVRWVF